MLGITRQPKMIETSGWFWWKEESLYYLIFQNLIGGVIDQSDDFSIEILKTMIWVHSRCDWDLWNFRAIQKPLLFQTSYSWAFPLAPLRRYRSFRKTRKNLHFRPNQPILSDEVGIRPYWVERRCLFSVQRSKRVIFLTISKFLRSEVSCCDAVIFGNRIQVPDNGFPSSNRRHESTQ
jgi:hypothetical protein